MVKKCLIAIAAVALLATTVQAITIDGAIKEEGTWPWTKIYDTMDICQFPVKLEVGHFVQVINCDDLEMKLEQVDCDAIGQSSSKFPCYGNGSDDWECVTLEVRANFPATFGAEFSSSGPVGLSHDLKWDNDDDTITGDGSDEELKLCMSAWNVELWNSGQTSGWITVGEITINVKPQNETGP